MKRIWSICLAGFLLSGCGFRPVHPKDEMPGTTVPEPAPMEIHETEPAAETDPFPAATGSRLPSRGCDFAFDGSDLILSWPDGSSYTFPDAAGDSFEKHRNTGVYVSESMSGAAFFAKEALQLHICTSPDRGKTWTEAVLDMWDPTPEGAEHRDFWLNIHPHDIWMGYTSESDGWLMLTTYYSMSSGKQFLYKTDDGGVSWERTYESEFRRYARGAGFSEKFGYLSLLRWELTPTVYRTSDGGSTWEAFDLLACIPEEYHECVYEACAPVFDGGYGEWAILCRQTPEDGPFLPLSEDYRGTDGETDGGTDAILILVTEDGGETWTIQE